MKKLLKFSAAFCGIMLCCICFLSKPIESKANVYGQWQDTDGDGYSEVRCTWFAWEQAYNNTGVQLPGFGNAKNWLSAAQSAGYSTGNTACANSIAVWDGGTYGHVTYVKSVNGTTMVVDEGGRTDLDHTSSAGVAYNQSAPATVGSDRWGLKLIGFIYLENSTQENIPVNSASLDLEKTGFLCAEPVTFYCYADGGNYGMLEIYKEGALYETQEVLLNTYTIKYFSEPGSYHAVYRVYDAEKSICSEPVNFSLHNTYPRGAENMDIGLEKYNFETNEHVTIYMFANYVEKYTLRIYKNDVLFEEVEVPAFHNCVAGNTYRIYSFDEEGSYRAEAFAKNMYNVSEVKSVSFIVQTDKSASTSEPVPTVVPTLVPTTEPTIEPTATPVAVPTTTPTVTPDVDETVPPVVKPTVKPTATPSMDTAVKKCKKVVLKSVKRIGDTKVKLVWKNVSDVNGYQVQYATDNKFKNKKNKYTKQKACTIKKLKKKKIYYFRVRAYKMDGKKKVYGKWSKVKKIKIKK